MIMVSHEDKVRDESLRTLKENTYIHTYVHEG